MGGRRPIRAGSRARSEAVDVDDDAARYVSSYDSAFRRPTASSAAHLQGAALGGRALGPEDSASQCGDRYDPTLHDIPQAHGWVPASFPIWAPSNALEERRFRKGFRVSTAALRDGSAAAAPVSRPPLEDAAAASLCSGDPFGYGGGSVHGGLDDSTHQALHGARAAQRSRSYGRPPVDNDDIPVAPQRLGTTPTLTAQRRRACVDYDPAGTLVPPQGSQYARLIPSAASARARAAASSTRASSVGRDSAPRVQAVPGGVMGAPGAYDDGVRRTGRGGGMYATRARSSGRATSEARSDGGRAGGYRGAPQRAAADSIIGGGPAYGGAVGAGDDGMERRGAYIEAAAFWDGHHVPRALPPGMCGGDDGYDDPTDAWGAVPRGAPQARGGGHGPRSTVSARSGVSAARRAPAAAPPVGSGGVGARLGRSVGGSSLVRGGAAAEAPPAYGGRPLGAMASACGTGADARLRKVLNEMDRERASAVGRR